MLPEGGLFGLGLPTDAVAQTGRQDALTAARGDRYTEKEITSMAVPRNRVARFLMDSRPQPESVFYSLSNFYREEFIKCQRCLDAQREYYSDSAISEVEQALTKVLAQLDRLCTTANANQVVSRLLQQFNTVAPPSAWSDPRHTH